MSGHEVVMLLLISLPFAIIGWVGGMMFMRGQYLQVLRWQRRQISKLERMIKAPQAGQNL
jgi:hypothetical protein